MLNRCGGHFAVELRRPSLDELMPTSTDPKAQEFGKNARGERLSALAARPLTWIGLTLIVAAIDYFSGPHVHVGLLYLLPLTLAAWYGGTPIALAIGVALPIARLSYFVFDVWEPSATYAHVALNAAVRTAVLTLVVLLVRRARRTRELERQVAVLRGMLPICMYCKRIQDDEGRWHSVEQYVAARSEAAFTHRICPICTDTHRAVFLGATP
jgi:hypothetical protein